MNLNTYFRTKINKSLELVQKQEKNIIQDLTVSKEWSIDDLTKAVDRLKEYKQTLLTLQEDAIANSTVKENIHLSNDELVSLNRIAHYYRFSQTGVSVEEREELIESLGYRLQDTKIK